MKRIEDHLNGPPFRAPSRLCNLCDAPITWGLMCTACRDELDRRRELRTAEPS
jgi:hypothetical protein